MLVLTLAIGGVCSDIDLELAKLKQRVKNLEKRLDKCQCIQNKRDSLNLKGKSYGGILRSGSSMDYDKIASLTEGEKVTILKQSNQKMNGYNWFKVKTSTGKVGYQWGGILCSMDEYQLGIYKVCE